MQLPNKLYSYKNSTLSLIPVILKEIQKGNTEIKSIFHAVSHQLEEPTDFLSIMDCLYALGTIEMSDSGEVELCL